MKLAAPCALCGSWSWCGRPCVNAAASIVAKATLVRNGISAAAAKPKRKPARSRPGHHPKEKP